MNFKFRRIFAFLIDMILVTTLANMIASTNMANPYLEDYNNATLEYNVKYNYALTQVESNQNPNDVYKVFSSLLPTMQKVESKMLFHNIWYFIFFIAYFIVFQFFTGGQTLGKRLFGIRIVAKNDDELTINNYVKRYMIHGSNLFNGITLFFILRSILNIIYVPENMYFVLYIAVTVASLLYEMIAVIYFIASKTHYGIHDKLGKTMVIDTRI